MVDADDKPFKLLRDTGPGKRLRLAIKEANIARTYIENAVKNMDEKSLESWRRRYVQCSEHASHAIGQLSQLHQWPPEATHAQNFVWVPKKAKRWIWKAA